jgi:GNAT superfamily N-acetyltransferase
MRIAVIAARRSRAFRLLARLTAPVRHRVDLSSVYHRDLRLPVPDARADVPVTMSQATPADVEAAALLAGPDFVQPFRARLEDGMVCFVAKLDGRVVAYNWTRYRSGEDEGDLIRLGPGEIYTTDALVDERLRGKRIHGQTLAYMLRRAREEGYVDAYTMRSMFRWASRKAMPGLGWHVSGRFLRIRVGPRIRVIAITGSPYPFHGGRASAPSPRGFAAARPRTRTRPEP